MGSIILGIGNSRCYSDSSGTITQPQKRLLAEFCNFLRSENPDIEALVICLVNNLRILPQNLTTKQIGMMVLDWTLYESETGWCSTLEAELERRIPDKIAELD